MAALVLLFMYPTSTGQSGTTAAEAVSSARVVSGSQSSTPSTAAGQGPDPATGGASGSAETSAGTGAAPTTTAPTAAAPATSGAAATAGTSTTVDGAAEMTRYGVVQVEVVITDGAIADVTALQYPNTDRKDQQINGRAIPLLRAAVLKAQSANVDGVSGATFTSDGYLTSLQSALDAAGFGQ
jgi:uncharacterized protein with FMN-binding domain